MSEGWIKIHRRLFDHWLWDNKPKSKFEAWVWMIKQANHNDKKFMLGNELIKVERGQIVTSELKMMDLFKWSKTKLRSFLKILENESMIEIKRDKKKTTLTLSNYYIYQDKETTKKPQKNHKETTKKPQKDTNKKDKHYKNEEKKELKLTAFEKWWPTYPKRKGKRVGKQEAKEQFLKLDFDQYENLKKATDNYSGEDYPKDACRFLKKDYWKDWIDGPSVKNQKKSTQAEYFQNELDESLKNQNILDDNGSEIILNKEDYGQI